VISRESGPNFRRLAWGVAGSGGNAEKMVTDCLTRSVGLALDAALSDKPIPQQKSLRKTGGLLSFAALTSRRVGGLGVHALAHRNRVELGVGRMLLVEVGGE
jgi:hypothetical protein